MARTFKNAAYEPITTRQKYKSDWSARKADEEEDLVAKRQGYMEYTEDEYRRKMRVLRGRL